MLREIFGTKRELTGGWRRLHNEESHDLYSTPNRSNIKAIRIKDYELDRAYVQSFDWKT
jgi:hypothetical protein